jgi:hypothetical protein
MRLLAKQTMADIEVCFAADINIRIPIMAVCEKLQSEDYSSVGRVLEWHNAQLCLSGLNSFEDI